MIRVVLDTNVIVSANLCHEGLPAAIIDLGLEGDIQMCVSKDVLAEYKDVLNRPRFKFSPRQIARFLSNVRSASLLVKPERTLTVSSDDAANRFLECASAATANYLVTGNSRHFPRRFEHTRIITPKEFIQTVFPSLERFNRAGNDAGI